MMPTLLSEKEIDALMLSSLTGTSDRNSEHSVCDALSPLASWVTGARMLVSYSARYR